MKKILIIITTLFLINSCSSNNVKNLVFQNYDSKKRELNLEKKDLNEIPNFSSLYGNPILNQITSIKLGNNKITKISKEDFSMIPNLNSIDLSNNEITNVEIDLKLLKTIKLNNNKIKTGTGFIVFDSIKNVNLSNNLLENLEGFDKYINLVAIDLSNNNLKDKDMGKFGSDKKLKYLLVTGNKINKELLKKIEKINLKYINSKIKNVDENSEIGSVKINTGTLK